MPTLVETARGCTVEYGNRFLYSRYDPKKSPCQTASAAVILPETLVLCVSPLLGYGLDVLLDKLPADSMILALEADENLMAFSVRHLDPALIKHPRFHYIRTNSPELAGREASTLPVGPFRRCLRIDLSGGASANTQFYADTVSVIDNWISGFWKNRVTLMKLGRNFTRNVFRNCASLGTSGSIQPNTVFHPIFVLGAGPSATDVLDFIKANRNRIFLLAVDTALTLLRDSNLLPDAVVILESQFWIEKSFIGAKNTGIPLFADMTSRRGALFSTGAKVSFFFTDYADTALTRRLAKQPFMPPRLPAMGSVGLAALLLARNLAIPSMPVFAAGLDFAWGKGFSHARGTTPVRDIHDASNRLVPVSSSCPDIRPGILRMTDKKGGETGTDHALSGYAALSNQFSRSGYFEHCYDLGRTGLPNGLSTCDFDDAQKLVNGTKIDTDTALSTRTAENTDSYCIQMFLEKELAQLEELKNLLIGKGTFEAEAAAVRIRELVLEMDYLYLHFPDGHKGYSSETGFLKRIRVETDSFIKTIKNALKDLSLRV